MSIGKISLAMGIALVWQLQAANEITPQAQRGQQLFTAKKCASCHKLGDEGTAIAPDITTVSRLSPRALRTIILATRTQDVIAVHLKSADIVPALRVSQDQSTLRIYDLSKFPPVLREIASSQIASIKDNDTWKHPPASADLTDPQVADLIAFIRWASYRDREAIDPDEIR